MLFVHNHDSERKGDNNNNDHKNHIIKLICIGLFYNLIF